MKFLTLINQTIIAIVFIEADDPDKALNLINKLVIDSIPRRFNINPIKDIQILSPMKKGLLGTNHLNQTLQKLLNKNSDQVERFGKIFRLNDRVLQTENDYDKDVFNGDLGYINKIDKINQTIDVLYDDKLVNYDFKDLICLFILMQLLFIRVKEVSIRL